MLSEPILLPQRKFTDERGFFSELSKTSSLKEIPGEKTFLQLNHSFSLKNALRGLHYQANQEKLLHVVGGKIWDVVVDIRKNSPRFGKHYTFTLDTNTGALWIPSGFAHGFLALEDSHLIYQTSSEHDPASEKGISWNDPELNIPWPVKNPILSQRDKNLPTLKNS